MALKFTATATLKKDAVLGEGIDRDDNQAAADQVRNYLVSRLPQAFRDGLIVTVQAVNKEGQPKGQAASSPMTLDAAARAGLID